MTQLRKNPLYVFPSKFLGMSYVTIPWYAGRPPTMVMMAGPSALGWWWWLCRGGIPHGDFRWITPRHHPMLFLVGFFRIQKAMAFWDHFEDTPFMETPIGVASNRNEQWPPRLSLLWLGFCWWKGHDGVIKSMKIPGSYNGATLGSYIFDHLLGDSPWNFALKNRPLVAPIFLGPVFQGPCTRYHSQERLQELEILVWEMGLSTVTGWSPWSWKKNHGKSVDDDWGYPSDFQEFLKRMGHQPTEYLDDVTWMPHELEVIRACHRTACNRLRKPWIWRCPKIGVTPIAGWFISWKIPLKILKIDDFGGYPLFNPIYIWNPPNLGRSLMANSSHWTFQETPT